MTPDEYDFDIMSPGTSELVGNIDRVLFEFGLRGSQDPNFLHTPRRWLKYLQHYCQPFDAEEVLGVTFPLDGEGNKYDRAMVIQGPIPYRAICAHHLVPVLGAAHLGYIPNERVVGLSKLTRLVHGMSHRSPSLQEDVGNAVVDALMEFLKPLGAMCVISAEHGCMAARGVQEVGVATVTSHVRGVFEEPAVRMEFLALAGIRR